MKIKIDENSGYCFGVEYAIQMAEENLDQQGFLYCLGDIVHNDMEVERLNKKGLKVIDREELKNIKNNKVLIRAHGEPPETYKIALENNLELVDASCPVVLKLQNRVKGAYDQINDNEGQIVIYGKKGHAEVSGLSGQIQEEAIIISELSDLEKIDFNKPIVLFSQTTKSTAGFQKIKQEIENKILKAAGEEALADFKANDSICRQVSNREPQLRLFSQENDIIIFVSGKKSSNGKALYKACKESNERSYFIQSEKDLQAEWFRKEDSVGICGATSTPMWLMQQVAAAIEKIG